MSADTRLYASAIALVSGIYSIGSAIARRGPVASSRGADELRLVHAALSPCGLVTMSA